AQPPLGDIHRSAALGCVLHDVDELALGADEQNVVTAENDVTGELLGQIQLPQGFLKIYDVNPVPLREDEAAHLGIPTPSLVSEVDAGLEELIQIGLSH